MYEGLSEADRQRELDRLLMLEQQTRDYLIAITVSRIALQEPQDE